jgi:DnaJ-class molecular chaperone
MFKRDGINLFYTYNISLVDALLSKSIQIITLDNRVLNIFIDEIISPNTVKQIENEGMPIIGNIITNEAIKGKLFVIFNVIFPKFISPENKENITRLLDDNSY